VFEDLIPVHLAEQLQHLPQIHGLHRALNLVRPRGPHYGAVVVAQLVQVGRVQDVVLHGQVPGGPLLLCPALLQREQVEVAVLDGFVSFCL
jgi:hypothetical protein